MENKPTILTSPTGHTTLIVSPNDEAVVVISGGKIIVNWTKEIPTIIPSLNAPTLEVPKPETTDDDEAKEREKEALDRVLEIWKTTIGVQQHFNDLSMRIRNFGLTLLTAMLGASAFALKDKVALDIGTFHTSLAAVLIVAAFLGWFGFFLMDRYWYHMLLKGSVEHAMALEKKYGEKMEGIGLSTTISRASPVEVLGIKLSSSKKVVVFYLIVGIGLALIAYGFHVTAPKPESKPSEVKAVGEAAKPANAPQNR